jgi:tRNA threonylcarbamoyladenosine biosynthesis protein TsaE
MTSPSAGVPPATIVRDLVDIAATQRLGAAVTRLLRTGDVVALWGELGAGKTTVARAVITELGYGGEVPSPTFTLVQTYDLSPVAVWHFDLYRIDNPDEVIELSFEEALAEAICLIEWPERMGPLLPSDRLDIVLSYTDDDDSRRAELRGHGAWRGRLTEAGDEF